MLKTERFHVSMEPWCREISLRFGIESQDGLFSVAQPIQMLNQEYPGGPVEPFLRIRFETAQALMDQLWNCGLRPSEGTGSAGAMAAVQRHLEDMRILVFKESKGKEPK